MADLKISALPASTVPLGGTEVLPIVQGSATKQVTVANLTAGRAISALSGTFNAGTFAAFPAVTIGASSETSRNYQMGMITGAKWALYENIGPTKLIDVDATGNTSFYGGNLIQGTAAKGVNFTANTPAAGMTSQLLNWYEEGTWTPSFSNLTVVLGAGSVAYTGRYTRIGRVVQCSWQIAPTGGATTASTANLTTITNLPFSITSSGAFPYPVSDNSVSNIGPGVFYSGTLAYTPTWSARTGVMVGSGTFIV